MTSAPTPTNRRRMPRRRSRYSRWSRYVPVAERRRNADRLALEQTEDGRELQPVEIEGRGRQIARTFWGGSWCTNLERYSDFANRLPRGRTYARNGSVIDLQVGPGTVTALVSGSQIYTVEIAVKPLAKARWRKLRTDCAGGIDSLVELLQGRFSDGVMDVLCRPGTGMFPEPDQLSLDCSCPDWAVMCKHVAAVLYGIGARLDVEPELLFALRQVDHTELISARDGAVVAATAGDDAGELAGEDLGALFGIELAEPGPPADDTPRVSKTEAAEPRRKKRPTKKTRPQKTGAKKSPAKKPSPKSPSTRKRRRTTPTSAPWITAAELRQRGVPNHAVQAWLNKGMVEHSGERGIYVHSEAVEQLVEEYLARKRPRRRRPSAR